VGIQAYINENFAVDMRVEASDSNLMVDGGRTDIERGSVNLLYDFKPQYRVSPYLFGGVGYEKLHRTYLDIKSQPFYQAGAGLKFDMSDNLEFVTEAKYIKKTDTKDSEVVATCGLGVKFGTNECEVSCDSLQQDIPKKSFSPKPAIKSIAHDSKQKAVVFSDEVIASKHLLNIRKTNFTDKKNAEVARGNYIQVAALSQKSNISKTLKKLKVKGLKTKILKKGKLTVVLVGPYSKRSIEKVFRKVKSIQKDAFYKKL
jgi:OOP family OmpA-OmpF porin